MSAKRTMYNEDKANAVFAVKIRKLFEENGKTHNSLAEFIEQRTGESVTRQAVGQWCNGNTCPNLRIVPIIAEFFGVSTDYLLTDTEIKTADIERKAVCEYTGLSERALESLELAKTIGADCLSSTINFVLEDIHDELLETIEFTENLQLVDEHESPVELKNGSHLLINLMYYLSTQSNVKAGSTRDQIMVSKSGKLIDVNLNPFEYENATIEDIITVKTVFKSEIVDKILFDDVCSSVKQAKKIYKKMKAGD